MKKILSSILCCILIFTCSFGLYGCIFVPYPYNREHKELYTTAIYSIPNATGYMYHGEGAYSSDIYVWEQDNYGRTLFSYCEDYSDQIFGLVVAQAYDETNVYFYPDINYALTFIDSNHTYNVINRNHLKNRTENFYSEYKDKLKEKNDWDKPIDKSKCVSYPITDHKFKKQNTYSFDSIECSRILNEYTKTLNLPNPEPFPHRYNTILQVDSEGRILHEIYGLYQHHDNPNWKKTDEYTFYSIILWVITDKDGNYDKEKGVMVMYSKENESNEGLIYNAEDVLEFKMRNNWSNSYCDE